jgi:phenylpyruvate tautomerase PptA (4-oxalocrotonate tautomerase family)
MVAALRVPSDDPTVLITEIDPGSVVLPGGVGDSYTIVQITMFEGRSIEAKRALYRGICTSLAAVGIPPSDILIAIVEAPTGNWGIAGGTPASEVELGFQVEM